jgi:5,10-methylenetetrahydromethanopterin reductase
MRVERGVELSTDRPVAEIAALGERAEAAGFDGVFASCHYNNRDPVLALGRLAAVTDEVRLGPAAANPYDTHPARLASQVATLAEVSDGRAVCGLGAGDRSTLRNLGFERERPLRRVLETTRVARALWRGERVTHDGTFVCEDAGLNYAPGEVPVYVGAQGPGMLRMAGEHADGALVNAAHPRDVAWARERVAEGEADRTREPAVDVAVYASVSVAEDRAAARRAARPVVAFIAAGAPERALDRHDLDRERARRVGAAIEAGDFDGAAAAVSDAMLDAFCAAGTPAEVETRLSDLLAHADGVVAAAPLGPDEAEALDLLAAVLD